MTITLHIMSAHSEVSIVVLSTVSTFVNACNVYPEGNVGNRDSGGVGNLNESYGRILRVLLQI